MAQGWMMPKGFDLKCEAGKTARVWLQGKGGGLTPGQALVLLPPKANEDQHSPAAYLSPLRTALIDRNDGHVNLVVCESDYLALKRGIENLPPGITASAAIARAVALRDRMCGRSQ
jgi:hypothetical protein